MPGDEVIGGTINKTGSFTFRATAVGADTVLAQIVRMVEQAQGSKLPIQPLVDRVTAWFVPAVMAVAALTFAVWLIFGPEPAADLRARERRRGADHRLPLRHGACDADLDHGRHRPRGAELGILFRKGEALQSLKEVSVVVLDKTGTLTQGVRS